MLKLKINTFKSGLIWYSCCELPAEEHERFYLTLHAIGLTYSRAYNKLLNKLKKYFAEKREDL